QAIYLGNLERLGDLGTDIKRVSVIVCIGALQESQVEPALDVSELAPEVQVLCLSQKGTNHCDTLRHVIHSVGGIRPGLDDNGGAFGEVEGPDLGLYSRVGQASSFYRL